MNLTVLFREWRITHSCLASQQRLWFSNSLKHKLCLWFIICCSWCGHLGQKVVWSCFSGFWVLFSPDARKRDSGNETKPQISYFVLFIFLFLPYYYQSNSLPLSFLLASPPIITHLHTSKWNFLYWLLMCIYLLICLYLHVETILCVCLFLPLWPLCLNVSLH